MKEKTAKQVKEIIEIELHKICDDNDKLIKESLENLWKEKDIMERMFTVSVFESKLYKGDFGIRVATDSDFYDLFYKHGNVSEANHKKVQEIINGIMGAKFTEEEHYFEHEGMGVLVYF